MPDPVNDQQLQDITLESLPDDVVASMESRDRWMATLPFEPGGFEFLVSDLQSWAPGQTVRVAFLGGSAELHEQIENGYEIGPQHVLAGETAELFAELTGAERVAFCNTGRGRRTTRSTRARFASASIRTATSRWSGRTASPRSSALPRRRSATARTSEA